MKAIYFSVLCLLLGGCGDTQLVDTTKNKVISNDEYAKLQQDATNCRNVGRYQWHKDGYRTWRLDTATGQQCIALTSEVDWKTSETADQGCLSQEWVDVPGPTQKDLPGATQRLLNTVPRAKQKRPENKVN